MEASSSSLNPTVLLLSSVAFCYYLVAKSPKGALRLTLLLPVFYLFSLLPWYFSSSFLRGIVSFFVTWIASFKLLLFCFHQGPLVSCSNSLDFVAISILPIRLKDNPPPQQSPSLTASKTTLLKLLGIILLLTLQNRHFGRDKYYPPNLHGAVTANDILLAFFKLVLAFYGFYLLVIILGAALIHAMGQYELVQLFNQPYLATSLQDFWGRRWNRYSSNVLRATIYDPTRKALAGRIGSGAAKTVAVISTLVVSGIMHEVLFFYITCGKRPTWEVSLFFVLHGFCMVLEAALKKLARIKSWTWTQQIPPALSIILTFWFVLLTSGWLLVLPVWRSSQNACA